ncbi:hypothetical protein D9757_014816 [Collybiopsis confluens]|uniref:Uncharacterized protein n=1 Tax=Collybiopsis confluens TaxID=2823264 RepID=A0A8H5G839_9AGAR|nr:hypothetical protein D9757_014816 [Collybiopsis confluens]
MSDSVDNSSSPTDSGPPAPNTLQQLSNEQLFQLLLSAVQGGLSAQRPAPHNATNAFPSLEPATLLDIARHDIRPMDLRKLDSKLCEKADDTGSTSLFLSRDSSTRDYPSLSALLVPLNLYFRVLIHFASSSDRADIITALSTSVLLYLDHLNDLNNRYEWPAVLQYHMEFHALRRREMIKGSYKAGQLQTTP